ncbi:MAG: nucleotidyltransferase family protein [Dehalobacterium sp.]
MPISYEIKEKRDIILSIASKHGASKVRIFGSMVRGDHKPNSDVDILINLDKERSLFDLIALKNDLEQLLGRKVDIVTENSVHRHLKNRIISEAEEV